jgi:hypothetical protein
MGLLGRRRRLACAIREKKYAGWHERADNECSRLRLMRTYIHAFLRPAAHTQRKQKQALSCRTFFIILATHRRDRESFFRCAPTQRMGFSSEMRAHRQWDYFSLSCVHAHLLKSFFSFGNFCLVVLFPPGPRVAFEKYQRVQ